MALLLNEMFRKIRVKGDDILDDKTKNTLVVGQEALLSLSAIVPIFNYTMNGLGQGLNRGLHVLGGPIRIPKGGKVQHKGQGEGVKAKRRRQMAKGMLTQASRGRR
jgi:hypothetical protein